MNRFYDYSKRENAYEAKSEKQITMQKGKAVALADFMTRNSGKEITKYHNVTPGLHGYVPQNLPWFLGRESKLSNYQSYDMHVSTALAYRERMHATVVPGSPDWNHRPDWEWMRQTGADFIIYDPKNPQNDPRLGDGSYSEFVDLSDPERVLALLDGTVVAPLKFQPLAGGRVAFDNGYVRLRSDEPGATVRSFVTDDATFLRMVVESGGPAVLEYEFWPVRGLLVSIKGTLTSFKVNAAGLPYVELPPGRSEVEIVYRNLWLTAFGVVYVLYGLTVLAFVLGAAVEVFGWRGGSAA